MKVNTREVCGCWVVGGEGRLDISNSGQFEKDCLAWIEQGHKNLVLDFSRLEYISSAGLRSILSAAKKAGSAGGSVSLCGLSGLVEEVVTVSGFDSILNVYVDVECAVAGAQK
jgi:anti-anti-sigma factor